MTVTYTYFLSAFPNRMVDAERLKKEILASEFTIQLVDVVFGVLGINQCDISFVAGLPPGEKFKLDGTTSKLAYAEPAMDSIIGAHSGVALDATITETEYDTDTRLLEREVVFTDESKTVMLTETVYTYSETLPQKLLQKVEKTFRSDGGVSLVATTTYSEDSVDGKTKVIKKRS